MEDWGIDCKRSCLQQVVHSSMNVCGLVLLCVVHLGFLVQVTLKFVRIQFLCLQQMQRSASVNACLILTGC